MSRFITRVELHYANDADYEKLHTAMNRQGFSRTITADDGRKYHLPTATYSLISYESIEQVRDRARVAAQATGKRNAVLVTEGGSAWADLQLVAESQLARR